MIGLSGFLVATASTASAAKHKATSHASKSKTPCLVGNWTVTKFTITDSGVSAVGGAGTQVDIAANKSVKGLFTPGAPLKSSAGSFKFSGTELGKYLFATKSTSKTGTFPVTYSPASTFVLSVNGGASTPVGAGPTTGSYTCTGKNLALAFPAGGSQITYSLVPTK